VIAKTGVRCYHLNNECDIQTTIDMSTAPTRPTHLTNYAELCLLALAGEKLGHHISLGGALGLLHYLDYRPTSDVDAWWQLDATSQERQRVAEAIEHVLATYGDVRKRAWGDVVSIELVQGSQKIFSFQIAQRTAQLTASTPAPWTDVLLDSLSDLLASKMVALVERGAPRDFRDIHAVCHAALVTPLQCWQLWQQRQELARGDTNPVRACLAIETHLARIERQRPLTKIEDLAQRAQAEQLRRWFREEFLHAAMA
jgi:hypothetical protein